MKKAPQYLVKTRDVDGSNTRKFVTLAGAIKRFEEMVGYSVANAIEEAYYDRALPAIEDLISLRAVSAYGTVVVIEALDETRDAILAAREARKAEKAAAEAKAAEPVAEPEPVRAAPECFYVDPVREMEANLAPAATMAEADSEYARNVGAERPEQAWILSDRDVWYANPAYTGPKVPHPEDYEPEYDGEDEPAEAAPLITATCSACDGEGRTKPDHEGMTRFCPDCGGKGQVTFREQPNPFAAPATPRAPTAAIASCDADDDMDIPF
jgi:hypothetical protein